MHVETYALCMVGVHAQCMLFMLNAWLNTLYINARCMSFMLDAWSIQCMATDTHVSHAVYILGGCVWTCWVHAYSIMLHVEHMLCTYYLFTCWMHDFHACWTHAEHILWQIESRLCVWCTHAECIWYIYCLFTCCMHVWMHAWTHAECMLMAWLMSCEHMLDACWMLSLIHAGGMLIAGCLHVECRLYACYPYVCWIHTGCNLESTC
jgi:hypothetical protein